MDREDLGKIHKNLPILTEIRDSDEGLRQTEIGDRLDYPNSTAHRKISWLEDRGVVQKAGSRYELTDLGRFVTDEVEGCVTKVENAAGLREFVDVVSEAELCFGDLEDCEVTRATDGNPVAPLVRLAELTAEASEVCVLTNSIAPESFEIGRERLRNDEQEVEMVMDSRTVDSIRTSDWFGDELERDLETGNLRLWVHDEPVQYQVGIMDSKLCLGAEDDNRMPVAVLETTRDEAVEWAQNEFERHREGAEELTPTDI